MGVGSVVRTKPGPYCASIEGRDVVCCPQNPHARNHIRQQKWRALWLNDQEKGETTLSWQSEKNWKRGIVFDNSSWLQKPLANGLTVFANIDHNCHHQWIGTVCQNSWFSIGNYLANGSWWSLLILVALWACLWFCNQNQKCNAVHQKLWKIL